MWTDLLKNTLLKPLLARLGTMGAGALVFGGQWLCDTFSACGLVSQDGAEVVMRYVIAVALLCFDLAVEWIVRRQRKAGR